MQVMSLHHLRDEVQQCVGHHLLTSKRSGAGCGPGILQLSVVRKLRLRRKHLKTW